TSVTRAIDFLERKNMVVRVPDPNDRRHKMIYLTHEGKAMKEKMLPFASETHQEATEGISPEELSVCLSVLGRVYHNLSTHIKS
ncbi:MAG: MarR family transcriptional regulator, partial [Bacteroidota bacterium]